MHPVEQSHVLYAPPSEGGGFELDEASIRAKFGYDVTQYELFQKDCIKLHTEIYDRAKKLGWTRQEYDLVELSQMVMFESLEWKIKNADAARQDGASWASHLYEVAIRRLRDNGSARAVALGFVHDVIEDTAEFPESPQITQSDLERIFSTYDDHFAHSVTLMTKEKTKGKHRKNSPVKTHRRLYELLKYDPEALLVKGEDRIHYLETCGSMPEYKRREKAVETLEYYFPLFVGLGKHEMARTLASLAVAQLVKSIDGKITLPIGDATYLSVLQEVTEVLENHRTEKNPGIVKISSRLPLPSDVWQLTKGNPERLEFARIPAFLTIIMAKSKDDGKGPSDGSFRDVARPIMLELLDVGLISEKEYASFAKLLATGVQRTAHVDILVHDIPIRIRFAREDDEIQWQASIDDITQKKMVSEEVQAAARKKIGRLKEVYEFYVHKGIKAKKLFRNIRDCLLKGTVDVFINREDGRKALRLPLAANATTLDMALTLLSDKDDLRIQKIQRYVGNNVWEDADLAEEVKGMGEYRVVLSNNDEVSDSWLGAVQTAYGLDRVQEIIRKRIKAGDTQLADAVIDRGANSIKELYGKFAAEQGDVETALRTDTHIARHLIATKKKILQISDRSHFLLRVGMRELSADTARTSLVWQVVQSLHEHQTQRRMVRIIILNTPGSLMNVTKSFADLGINIADMYVESYYDAQDKPGSSGKVAVVIILDNQEYTRFMKIRPNKSTPS